MDQPSLDIDSIFLTALEKNSPEELASYLSQACGQDTELRRRVERLLAAYPKAAGSFLESGPAEFQATIAVPPIQEGAGTIIGRYKLLQQIGEGGFGVVYMAEQHEPVSRKVALKIIKPGMDTKEVIARFEAERQALALMDHPHIARVFDGGATDSGRPYFVMELVRGIPITAYCDENNLSPRERLELFVSVCQAVQHAHQKGIIHRDVKPGNVLVTLHDGKPVVKVIDFGVAKAIDRRLTERTLFTRFTEMIGTPLYMSPEQAEMSGLDVDTRTDIYSLGVLLYELLTGSTPFDKKRLGQVAYDEIRRIIREEEPSKPSTKVSTLGETAATVSKHRQMEPKKLSALLKGDLDWVVMKALEKDRTRRYETAKDFADDVQHYLTDQPIEARPPSTLYRFRKLVRRYRGVAASITAIAVVLLLATGLSTWMAIQERLTNRQLQIEKEHVRAAKDRAEDSERKALEGMESSVRAVLAQKNFKSAERIATETLEMYRVRFGDHDIKTTRAAALLAEALDGLSRPQEADELLEGMLARQLTFLGKDSAVTAETANHLAQRYGGRAFRLCVPARTKRADAERALAMMSRVAELQPNGFFQDLIVGIAHYRLGNWQAALNALQTSAKKTDGHWDGIWSFLAMTHWQIENKELARDFSALATLPIRYEKDSDPYVRQIQTEAAALIRGNEKSDPHQPTASELSEVCSRLQGTYPTMMRLNYYRSGFRASEGQWKDAASDLEKWIQSRPQGQIGDMEGWVAYLLMTQDDQAAVACRRTFDTIREGNFHKWVRFESGISSEWSRLVILCMLVPSASIELNEIDGLVTEAQSEGASENMTGLMRGMIAYRRARFNEALNLLPELEIAENISQKSSLTGGNDIPRSAVLSAAFRAMAHHQLRHESLAAECLRQAKRGVPTSVPTTPYLTPGNLRYLYATWCLAHAALREAETLIGPIEDTATAAGKVSSDKADEASSEGAKL